MSVYIEYTLYLETYMTYHEKEGLNLLLKSQVIIVHFTKIAGESRTMKCTLNETLIPQTEKKTERTKKRNPDVCSVYDIENNGWRSFRYDSFIKWEPCN